MQQPIGRESNCYMENQTVISDASHCTTAIHSLRKTCDINILKKLSYQYSAIFEHVFSDCTKGGGLGDVSLVLNCRNVKLHAKITYNTSYYDLQVSIS